MIENNVDMLHISEIKLDDSFPSGQEKVVLFPEIDRVEITHSPP